MRGTIISSSVSDAVAYAYGRVPNVRQGSPERRDSANLPQDIALAKALLALSPSAQTQTDIASSHGADILLGGHDHLYYVSKGVTSWQGFDVNEEVLGAENDQGDVLVVKSGTDFRDLSEFTLELEDTPTGSVRRKVIKQITGV